MKQKKIPGGLYVLAAASLLIVLLFVWTGGAKASTPVPIPVRYDEAEGKWIKAVSSAPAKSSQAESASIPSPPSAQPPPNGTGSSDIVLTVEIVYNGIKPSAASSEADAASSEADAASLEADAAPSTGSEAPAAVNLNTATKEELMALKGIGAVLAQRILEFREAAGGFQTVEELLNIKGIGEKTLENIRSQLYV